jgi:hypothetical protein
MHLYTIIYITQLTMMIYPRGCDTSFPPASTRHKTHDRLPVITRSGNGKRNYTWTGHGTPIFTWPGQGGFHGNSRGPYGTRQLRFFKRHGDALLPSRAFTPISCASSWYRCWFGAGLLGTSWHDEGGNVMLGSSQVHGSISSGTGGPRWRRRQFPKTNPRTCSTSNGSW